MAPYIEADLNTKTLETWRGEDFALFNYPPRKYERFVGVNDTTRLILDFKNAVPGAIELVTQRAIAAISRQRMRFREELACGYTLAVPRSVAGQRNNPCEAVAKALGQHFGYLKYMPDVLKRTSTLSPSHLGERHSVDEHVASIHYTGPSLGVDLSPRYCREHAKQFKTEGGLQWHLERVDHRTRGPRAIIMVDDVMTLGSTGDACRQVLLAESGVPRVIGFFIGKTDGW